MKKQKPSFPMTNESFLKVIANSFLEFLESETSRSTKKLKPLHGAVAEDLQKRLGKQYKIFAQGWQEGKEKKLKGRYYEKMVDIVVEEENRPVAGVGVKFIMQNYLQNSNNYFENMLGETANIRSEKIPYFQIFIVFDKLPYYEKGGQIKKWETITKDNLEKYVALSEDDITCFFHTPNKTLIYIIHIPENNELRTKRDYCDFYKQQDCSIDLTENPYEQMKDGVIFNDYEKFIEKVFYTIKAQ